MNAVGGSKPYTGDNSAIGSDISGGWTSAEGGNQASATPGLGLAVFTLWRREMVRFFRQRNRVIGAVGTPLIFWLVLGFGFNRVFVMAGGPRTTGGQQQSTVLANASHDGGASVTTDEASSAVSSDSRTANGSGSSDPGYLAYFFPGTIMLMVLFTAIFATIGVIEDRQAGFLQAVLVSPVSRFGIVLGNVLGGASIAAVQGVVFLVLWPIMGHWPGLWSMVGAAGVLFAVSIGLTGLGLAVGWSMRSTAGFHAIMNLVLMPMWLLCGAVFPLDSAGPLKYVMYANPLTYGYSAFASLISTPSQSLTTMPLGASLPITGILIVGVVGLCVMIASRRPE